ncbi:MAG: alanine/ornithine racemase family PLP-dependent enzyme [Bacillota bacterium]
MRYPSMSIDVGKLEHNAVTVSRLLARAGLTYVAVNKATCGHPDVAKALLAGNPLGLADSRVENLARLRESGYQGETVLLRAPAPARCAEAVEVADTSLISDPGIARALGEAAVRCGKKHNVILMVDIGDRREGVLPDEAPETARAMASIPGIRLIGIGTNLACYGAIIPTREKMETLLEIKDRVEKTVGFSLERVSGGNSANIPLVMEGQMPRGITELRLGESVILGTEAVERTLIPGCHNDAFLAHAEVIEVIRKPSLPSGKIGQDAFGAVPMFVDRGNRMRAILAIGRQDADPDGLTPLDEGVTVIGASSDHLICDVEDAGDRVKVGTVLSFIPNYSALLRLATSPYVEKVVKKP